MKEYLNYNIREQVVLKKSSYKMPTNISESQKKKNKLKSQYSSILYEKIIHNLIIMKNLYTHL